MLRPTEADNFSAVDDTTDSSVATRSHGDNAATVALMPRRTINFADVQQAAADGEPWALNSLASEYLPRLRSFAANRNAADPDGIAHLALMSVLPRLGELEFDNEIRFWAYLCRAARSRMIDERRSDLSLELVGDIEGFERRLSPVDAVDDQVSDQAYVAGLLQPLPSDQREVLELRYLADLSVQETADRLGRSPSAVKRLQRRALSAIVAAVAVLVVAMAVQWSAGRQDGQRLDPVDEPGPVVDEDGNRGDDADRVDDDRDSTVQVDGVDSDTQVADDELSLPSTPGLLLSGNESAEADEEASATVSASRPRFDITSGTGRSGSLTVTAPSGAGSAHGVRVYCVASHVGYDDPIKQPGRSGTAPANIFWGNTTTSAATTAGGLAGTGNSTCNGGVANRSAYWMPALFDASGQFSLPSRLIVELKAFNVGSDRSVIQPVPNGLQLVADASVKNWSADKFESVTEDGDLAIKIAFPECVAVDRSGAAVLNEVDGSHLAYRVTSSCPRSHPMMIPKMIYTARYPVALDSAWSLAGLASPTRSLEELSAGAISSWDDEAMTTAVDCVRRQMRDCSFRGPEDDTQSQLPERFVNPAGETIYLSAVRLAPGTDTTPFGNRLSPLR